MPATYLLTKETLIINAENNPDYVIKNFHIFMGCMVKLTERGHVIVMLSEKYGVSLIYGYWYMPPTKEHIYDATLVTINKEKKEFEAVQNYQDILPEGSTGYATLGDVIDLLKLLNERLVS